MKSMVQFLLQKKVLHTCAHELIHRGFTSLYALALAEPEDLQGPEISTGQRRLISHLVKVLRNQSQSNPEDTQQLSGHNSGQAVRPTTDSSTLGTQSDPKQGQPIPSDIYGAAIVDNMIAEQRQLASVQAPGNSSTPSMDRPKTSTSNPRGMTLRFICQRPLVSRSLIIMIYAILYRGTLRKKPSLVGRGSSS